MKTPHSHSKRLLRRASFPLPLRYERPELRFTLRDGARFAAYLQSIGVDAAKLLLGDPSVDKLDSPLLKVASQAQYRFAAAVPSHLPPASAFPATGTSPPKAAGRKPRPAPPPPWPKPSTALIPIP